MTSWGNDGVDQSDVIVMRIERNLNELKATMKKAKEDLENAHKQIEELRREHYASTRV